MCYLPFPAREEGSHPCGTSENVLAPGDQRRFLMGSTPVKPFWPVQSLCRLGWSWSTAGTCCQCRNCHAAARMGALGMATIRRGGCCRMSSCLPWGHYRVLIAWIRFIVTLQVGKWSPGRFNALRVPYFNHIPYNRALVLNRRCSQ